MVVDPRETIFALCFQYFCGRQCTHEQIEERGPRLSSKKLDSSVYPFSVENFPTETVDKRMSTLP